MPSTRRSPHAREGGHPFRPRFERDSDAFLLRQSLRCREEIVRLWITLILQTGLLLAFVLFARTLVHVFRTHGSHLAAWLAPLVFGFVGVAILLAGRRIWRLVAELREVRRDLREYRRQLHDLELPS